MPNPIDIRTERGPRFKLAAAGLVLMASAAYSAPAAADAVTGKASFEIAQAAAPETETAPATEAPATEVPAEEAPATEAPATDAPEAEAPAAETPAANDTASAPAVEAPEPEGTVDMEAVLEEGALPDMVLGEADAPVTIVEYASLTCPHCASFHTNTFEELKEKYIDTGQVRFIMRDFPFDPRAAAGAMLARCAPEGKYFPMVDMLFEQQSSWATAQDARGALLQLSRMAGFTQESFEACLTNQELLDDVNAVRQKAAEEFDVQSTPTFLINGQRYAGAMSIEQFSAIIDGQL